MIGLTTAYCLSRATKRYDIHIVDHREKPAAGCSYQNGGVINVESITPVNAYMSPPKSIWASLQYRLQGKPTNTMITWRALAEPGLFHWCWYFYRNTSPESIQANSKKMLALGTASGLLWRDAVRHLGLNAKGHNFNSTPGLLLSRVADPVAVANGKKEVFDSIHPKTYVTEPKALAGIQRDSGLANLAQQGYNFGCVEPHNLTINTRKFCQSLADHLEAHGVCCSIPYP